MACAHCARGGVDRVGHGGPSRARPIPHPIRNCGDPSGRSDASPVQRGVDVGSAGSEFADPARAWVAGVSCPRSPHTRASTWLCSLGCCCSYRAADGVTEEAYPEEGRVTNLNLLQERFEGSGAPDAHVSAQDRERRGRGAHLSRRRSRSRRRSEIRMLDIPAVVETVAFPVLFALGTILGKYDKFKDAPEPVMEA